MKHDIIKSAAARYPELIPQPYADMLAADGYEALHIYCHYFNGSNVYVPSIRTIFYKSLMTDIIERYDGNNLKQLAREYGYSERYLIALLNSYTGAST